MNAGPANAALLVDWENIRIGLNAERYHCYQSRDVAEQLVKKAREAAQGRQLNLRAIKAYLPPSDEIRALLDSGIDPVPVPGGPQAADAMLISEAMRVVFEDKYQLVIIVANDAGFVATARALQAAGIDCLLWAVNRRSVRDDVRQWHLTSYLEAEDMLALKPCASVGRTPQALFSLACMRMAFNGRALWGYQQSIKDLENLEFLGLAPEVRTQWDLFDRDGMFATDQAIDAEGRPVPKRRLAFERREVWRPLVIADVAIREIGRQRGQRSREEVLTALQHPLLENPNEAVALFDALSQSGFMVGHDLYSLPVDYWRFGTIGAMRRVVLSASAVACEEGRRQSGDGAVATAVEDRLSLSQIAKSWPRHVMPQRRVSQREFHQLREQGNKLVRMAEATGVLMRHYDQADDGRPISRFSLREHHPIVRRTATSVVAAIDVLRDLGGHRAAVPQEDLFERMRNAGAATGPHFGWTEEERRELVRSLAACRIVNWRQQQVSLTGLADDVRQRLAPLQLNA